MFYKILKEWLESQFYDGMTWENYGSTDDKDNWHIDHVSPCELFDLTIEEDN